MTIPRKDPLGKRKPERREPARSITSQKLRENATDADLLKGKAISTNPPAAGHVLVFDGDEYVPQPMSGGGGSAGTVAIEDEGVAQGNASIINFAGAGVSATVAAGEATVTISGGGGGTLDDAYDSGGAGAGRTINATDGAVLIQNSEADLTPNIDLRRELVDLAKPISDSGVTGDANPYYRRTTNGKIQWGTGGATAVDTQLARNGVGILKISTPGGAAGTLEVNSLAEQITNGRIGLTDGITINQVLGLTQDAATLTVGGQLTATHPWMVVTSNSGTSDDMDNLATTGIATADGDTYFISAASGHTITIRDNSVSGGNISTMTGSAIVLDSVEKVAVLMRDGTTYYAGTLFSSGGSGDVATDAIWDAAGDLAVGTGANTAARLGVGGANTVLQPSGGTVAWVTDPTFNGVTVLEAFALGANTSVNWAAQTDNYALGDVARIDVTLTGNQTLTGVSGGAEGRLLFIQSQDTVDTLTIAHASGSSLAANRFYITNDILLGPREGALFAYSSGTPGWYCIARYRAQHNHTTADGSGVLTNDEHDGYSEIAEIADPSTPAANKARLYTKDGGASADDKTILAYKDDAGIVVPLKPVITFALADTAVGTSKATYIHFGPTITVSRLVVTFATANGGTAQVFDFNKNGTSIATVTVAASGQTGENDTIANTAIAEGDIITIDHDSGDSSGGFHQVALI